MVVKAVETKYIVLGAATEEEEETVPVYVMRMPLLLPGLTRKLLTKLCLMPGKLA